MRSGRTRDKNRVQAKSWQKSDEIRKHPASRRALPRSWMEDAAQAQSVGERALPNEHIYSSVVGDDLPRIQRPLGHVKRNSSSRRLRYSGVIGTCITLTFVANSRTGLINTRTHLDILMAQENGQK